ncbi:hypothetical protein [Oceanicaulis sp. MMSF_3324]|uniref:hypothetical protein n=1 Tax=Oceanicaulis sp. MMSF_3324 TaxID=3046702 RepID=UPI00273E7E2E|nr:hypothetical protein [Oceanicaulis sp. MMSF_3324]
MTYGFEGDPLAIITTKEVAERLGYPSMRAWYADAARRRAARFPRPQRRGFYRLGALQDWMTAGGFEVMTSDRPAPPVSGSDPAQAGEDFPPRFEPGPSSPRPEVLARLRVIHGSS